MTDRLSGGNVLVTGAGSGMGRAIARLFAAEGAAVILADRDLDAVSAGAQAVSAAGGSARAVMLDVTDVHAWTALEQALRADERPLTALVHCAGVGSAVGGGPDEPDAYRTLLDVNALGTLLALRFGGRLLAELGGAIVTVSSVTAVQVLEAPELNVGYAASKSAVRSLTRSFARAHGRRGIRINCILPGFMEPMRGSRMPDGDAGESPYLPRIPLARTGTAEDVASVALFLVSDDAAYVTGIDLPVDGGFLA